MVMSEKDKGPTNEFELHKNCLAEEQKKNNNNNGELVN